MSKKKSTRKDVVKPCGGTCVFEPCEEPCCFEENHRGRCKCEKHKHKPTTRISPMLILLLVLSAGGISIFRIFLF